MDKLLIHGGVPLSGEIRISGRQECGAADPVRGDPDAETLQVQQRAASARRHHQLSLLAQMGVEVSLDERLGVSLNAAPVCTTGSRPTSW